MNYEEILDALETGSMRAASPSKDGWVVNIEVKQAILQSFKEGVNTSYEGIYEGFVDKHNLPPNTLAQKIRFDSFPAVLRCVEEPM